MRYLMLILLLILSGCSQANTRGDQWSREYNIKIRNNGYLVIYTPLDVTAGTETKTSVDAANSPTTRNNANASLAGQGATATGAVGEAVKQALEGVESVSRRILKDSHNQQTVKEQQQAPVENEEKQVEQNPAPKPEPKPEPVVDNGTGAPADFDLTKVHWLHTDVSKWPVTSKLRSVKIVGDKITLDYDAANKWAGGGVVANPWIFVKQGGRWYAATWEWLRPGQTTKALYAVSGSHIKRDPLKKFEPVPGETYGFMVSGLARDRKRNVEERTNIVWVKWPGRK